MTQTCPLIYYIITQSLFVFQRYPQAVCHHPQPHRQHRLPDHQGLIGSRTHTLYMSFEEFYSYIPLKEIQTYLPLVIDWITPIMDIHPNRVVGSHLAIVQFHMASIVVKQTTFVMFILGSSACAIALASFSVEAKMSRSNAVAQSNKDTLNMCIL